jgi:transposase-like protein
MKKQIADSARVADLVRDLLITQLASAGVGQTEIRQIVGCDIVKVNRIVKHMKRRRNAN